MAYTFENRYNTRNPLEWVLIRRNVINPEGLKEIVRHMEDSQKGDLQVFDPKKSNEMVRGVVNLPHGTGKKLRVLALVPADKENDAREAGADMVGLDEYLQKIKDGWTDIDVIITMPSIMGKLGPLGKVLGPRGLMPNPKAGTVTNDISSAIKEFKAGKLEFRADKAGIVHVRFGKASFSEEALLENLKILQSTIEKNKPSGAKGKFWRSFYITSTMGPSVEVDINELQDLQKEK